MRRYESGAGCGTRERGEVLELTPATTSGGPPGKACLGNTGPAGPATVNAISGTMPRGARLERWIASRMMRPGPMRVVRPVRPGPPWRNPGHALLGAPPLALGGSEREEDGQTPTPEPKSGVSTTLSVRCLTSEEATTAGADQPFSTVRRLLGGPPYSYRANCRSSLLRSKDYAQARVQLAGPRLRLSRPRR